MLMLVAVLSILPLIIEGYCPAIISRSNWGARASKSSHRTTQNPADYVVVHHSNGATCSSLSTCKNRVKGIQNDHMNNKGWQDIGYNFLIGGDGNVYEGKGWGIWGSHIPGFKSIGICVIGNFESEKPSETQLETLKSLISCAKNGNYIRSDYQLIGHRQGSPTSCPGNQLFNEISRWPNFDYTVAVLPVLPVILEGSCPTIISRSEWGARAPKSSKRLAQNPAPYVVVHHSEGATCSSLSTCKNRIKGIQKDHMNNKGWKDIAYNFLIGGDGNVYEGRGWGIWGSHVHEFNSKSIGICVIGNFQSEKPSRAQLQTLKKLIACAKDGNYIKSDYHLIGHRQGSYTSCPGNQLFDEISNWSNFDNSVTP